MRQLDWLPQPEAAPTAEPLVDRAALVQQWEHARQQIHLAAEWGKLPDPQTEFIYHPHLDVLRERILKQYTYLADPEVIKSCLLLIGKLREDVGATILGLTMLRTAFLHAQDVEHAEYIADLQAEYLAELGFSPEAPHEAKEPATASEEDASESGGSS